MAIIVTLWKPNIQQEALHISERCSKINAHSGDDNADTAMGTGYDRLAYQRVRREDAHADIAYKK